MKPGMTVLCSKCNAKPYQKCVNPETGVNAGFIHAVRVKLERENKARQGL